LANKEKQLDIILSDDLEVIVMLKDNLGAEYFNKKEFTQKVIIPTASLKAMKIIELKMTLKIRFNLSELNKNNMINKVLYILIFMSYFSGKAQSESKDSFLRKSCCSYDIKPTVFYKCIASLPRKF